LFRGLTSGYDRLIVPDTVPELCSSRVITMDYIEGRKVTDIGPLGLLDVDARPVVDQLFAAYLRMILVEGVIHADPHPGNVLLTPTGELALLDLGMVATVSERVRGRIVKLLLALSDGDGETCAEILAGMGHPLREYDPAGFRDHVSHLVSRAVALGGDVQAGSVIVELSRVSGQFGLRPPAEMSMIGKALLNLDQITAHLDPSFAPAEAIRGNVTEIMNSGLTDVDRRRRHRGDGDEGVRRGPAPAGQPHSRGDERG
jgi:ubiquinone biosynthesis protein